MLGAISALPPLSIDLSLPGLPLIVRALHTSGGAVQASLSVFMFAFGAAQLAVGPLSDRFGRRPILLAGLAVFTVAGVACAAATDVSVLLAGRFFQGAGACAGTVVARAVVADVATERTRAASLQAYVNAVNSLAPLIAPIVGVAILAVTGWRLLFVTLIAIGVVSFVASLVRLPETAPQRAGNAVAAYRRSLALPRTIPLAVVSACAFGAYFALISGSSLVLVTQMHLARGPYAVAFGTNALAGIAGSIVAARLGERIGTERLFALGIVLLAVAGAAACLMDVAFPGPIAFVATFSVVAFAFGIVAPSAIAGALSDAGRDSGLVAGVLGAAQMLGGAAGSAAAAGATGFAPAAAVGTTAAALAVATAGAYLRSRRR